MTYLGRAVFEFEIDWSDEPSKRFSYDLRESQIGHGKPRIAPLQQDVMVGWDLDVTLESETKIVAFDAFTEALTGRLTGFWLPSPMAGVVIVAGVSGTEFDITDQELTETWQDRPDQYLFFKKAGQTSQAAKITEVLDNGDGTERVTVDASVTVDGTWEVFRLVYVRLASDEEEAEFVVEGWQQRSVKVEELPTEYALAETGQKPIWLYHFYTASASGGTDHWYYTSFSQAISSTLNGTIGAASFVAGAITHNSLRRSLRAESEETSIKTFWEAGNPLQKFFPLTLLKPLYLDIWEATYATPNTATQRFSGQVQHPTLEGNEISARCVSLLDALGRQFPRMMIGARCNNFLFDGGCKLVKGAWQIAVTVDQINGVKVTLGGAGLAGLAANYFAFGWIETARGEIRAVLANTAEAGGSVILTLNVPFATTIETDAAAVFPGCDGVLQTCIEKFDNLINFGGQAYIQKNLTIRAMEAETAHGNKK